ncbi:hypothetical protein THMIRHAS_11630 [Thiosulfatimonas sediminis]|uniref:Nucleoprotein/polynucleotide-associated enzyme n=1 Tax=Thiosulfatimonas sediminis TaxID=2675054 RepID=A0A6F8PUY7_9GAMM|nr:DUF2058 domain-containing protein [Thiosulfatimonas sediminis]BBP45790.1 hypothetical protein THMIRHAS_11630 [Thiosulfatimonas sediminis]
MAASLFDQLKKSGLVSDKKAKQVQREKQQNAKQKNANKAKKGETQLSEVAQLAAQAAEEKAQRDRVLNQQRQQEQAEKAKQAELKQLIESNQLRNYFGEMPFNFADGTTVKTLNVNASTHRALVKEQLLIVHFKQSYTLVSAELLDKIEQRDPSIIVRQQSVASKLSKEDEDYYAKFAIPDDLVW